MQTPSKTPRLGELAGHAATGAGLGLFLSLTLIISNTGRIFEALVNSSNPKIMTLMFVGTFSFILAVGATLTGLIFSVIEQR
jgi:hypothetical protein